MSYILPVIENAAKDAIKNIMIIENADAKLLFIAQYIEALQKEFDLLKDKQKQVKISNN